MSAAARRHDLDALRAVAMLLGIVVHAILSFMPTGWLIQDSQQERAFLPIVALIHGFRMPLFVLLSGYFTAMLWRKRGLRALLQHRFKRIFLPLVVGGILITPISYGLLHYAKEVRAYRPPLDAKRDLWAAIRLGDEEAVKTHVDSGALLDKWDAVLGLTPLSTAAVTNQAGLVDLLIRSGSDLQARNRDGTTALHIAALFGRCKVIELLLENGANVSARDHEGRLASELENPRNLPTYVVHAAVMGVLDQEFQWSQLAESQALLDPAGSAPDRRVSGWRGFVRLLQDSPIFIHLWFLELLCWLVCLFAIYVWCVQRWKIRTHWQAWIRSPWCYFWIVPITAIAQYQMHWPMTPRFGPDGMGLLPTWSGLLYFGLFYFVGAWFFDSEDDRKPVGCYWWITLPMCLALVFPLGYWLTMGQGITADEGKWNRPIAVVFQALYAWMMAFSLIGLFRWLLSSENRIMRYLSDSAYWVYLAHLPLILLGQLLIRDWPLSPWLKLIILCSGSAAILLASYHWCVRETVIGVFLNGSRKPRARYSGSGDL